MQQFGRLFSINGRNDVDRPLRPPEPFARGSRLPDAGTFAGLVKMCGRGGTGRRASLRSMWANARGSSSLLDRTIFQHFNDLGQREVARRDFFVCQNFLSGKSRHQPAPPPDLPTGYTRWEVGRGCGPVRRSTVRLNLTNVSATRYSLEAMGPPTATVPSRTLSVSSETNARRPRAAFTPMAWAESSAIRTLYSP
jgi:hypothetical protein